jgi:two-component system OmpR family sensor kinase
MLRRWPITVRGALLASVAMALLALIASWVAFAVVRGSLQASVQASLRLDAERVAALYRGGVAGRAVDQLAGPTGGAMVQLYDPLGNLLAATSPRLGAADALLATALVVSAREGPRDHRGVLAGMPVQVALAPFPFGVVAVVAETAFIGSALAQLARNLALASTALVILSRLVGWGLAREIVRPLRVLARAAMELGPERLTPIPEVGTRDEVARLTRVLNALIADLGRALDAQRSFLAETSHELRTPLTSLQGFLARAERHGSGPVLREIRDAQRVAGGMARLVGDLLQLSRGELVRELEPFLVDLYREVLEPVAEEFPGVRLVGEGGALVLGDPGRLRQLLRNLTANAVRAAGAAAVTLRLEGSPARVLVSVHDSGPGIPIDQQTRVFEKFWTGGGGSGLGLAIARQIAHAHGGDLTLASVPGDTTFTLELPRIEEDEGVA